MDNRYKIILSNKNLYKEIELFDEMQQISIGTGKECDVRLFEELFFDEIELHFDRDKAGWVASCSGNLYFSFGGAAKLLTTPLRHGNIVEVHYQQTGTTAFSLEFLIDFDGEQRLFNRKIDIRKNHTVAIGADQNCDIVLSGRYTAKEKVEVSKAGKGMHLTVKGSFYGIYLNGKKIDGNQPLRNGDFFSIADIAFCYKDGFLLTETRKEIQINGLPFTDEVLPENYPLFNRNTRIKTVVNEEKIEILDPPAKPQKPKNNLLMRLLPSMGMLIAAGVMASRGGATMLIFSGISAVMSVVTAVIGLIESKKEYQKNAEERIEKYNAYIDNKRRDIEQFRSQEQQQMNEIFISMEEEKRRLRSFSPDLFDRRKEDDDFLCVRLGYGDVKAKREIDYKKQERLEYEDGLQQIPEELHDAYECVHNAPIVCDLKSVNAVGIIGTEQNRFDFMKNMLVDLAARQYYSDLQLALVAEPAHKYVVWWIRSLPHLYNEALGIRNVVCDDGSKNILFEYLYKELSVREQQKQYDHHIVVFFFDEYGFKNHPLSKHVDSAKELGITFVFFGQRKEDIPMGCGNIINLQAKGKATLIDTQDCNETHDFVYEPIANEDVVKIVDLLAPVYTEEVSLESSLTKNISLFELLHIFAVNDLRLAENWTSSRVFQSMAAPIGVSKTGIVQLDLHDKAHGPHGLVAGTTGSGKSELLQTYILSMSVLFHPYEVGFVIIDFKGGGMANQFRALPHLLGAITNIDGKAIDRSLKSIKAELQKRQRLFAEAEVNHIDNYIRKFKEGQVTTALPHLIIIVDEFAELKADQPEFMKELISASRIGRSLGVHLILATQKPSGQVSEQIWSNSRFKLCLKVQSPQDSNEVLKSPLAAEIKEPGRAYLQVGNNEIFELFQSAYSGASEKSEGGKEKEFVIYELTESGRRVPVYVKKKNKDTVGGRTQLDAIVEYVAGYCASNGIKKLSDICLPALETKIPFPENTSAAKNFHIVADIGVYDDPDNQYQGVYSIDLTENNLMIIGSAQSGKTNLLQTILRGVSERYSPEEVNFYIIDFASMVLKNFEELHHVGGVVCPSDDEKLKNLFKLLYAETEHRKQKLMQVGVSSFAAYREAGKTDLPQIILMIDNVTVLKELYLQDEDRLEYLCREGISVGICVIIANANTNVFSYKYRTCFPKRIALYCSDNSEYNNVFVSCKVPLDNIQGRGIIEIEKRYLEYQTYLAFDGKIEKERNDKIKAFTKKMNGDQRYLSLHAREIPVVPEYLSKEYIMNSYGEQTDREHLIVGLDYATVAPISLSFTQQGVFTLVGDQEKSKNGFLKYLKTVLLEIESDFYIMDDDQETFADMKDSSSVSLYANSTDTDSITYVIQEMLSDIVKKMEGDEKEKLVGRNIIKKLHGYAPIKERPPIVLILNNESCVSVISENKELLSFYKSILEKYVSLKMLVLFTKVENKEIKSTSPEILRMLKDNKQLIYFGDIQDFDLFYLTPTEKKKFQPSKVERDAFLFKGNETKKIKTVDL